MRRLYRLDYQLAAAAAAAALKQLERTREEERERESLSSLGGPLVPNPLQ